MTKNIRLLCGLQANEKNCKNKKKQRKIWFKKGQKSKFYILKTNAFGINGQGWFMQKKKISSIAQKLWPTCIDGLTWTSRRHAGLLCFCLLSAVISKELRHLINKNKRGRHVSYKLCLSY